jgi:hypothetical protein
VVFTGIASAIAVGVLPIAGKLIAQPEVAGNIKYENDA